MRFERNRHRLVGAVPQPSRAAVRAFHRTLPGYLPTPLHDLTGLARTLGLGRVLVKDEGHRFGLKAFKGLGASWAIHQLRRQGAGRRTVASATEGNHGRAVAWTARQLGLGAVIFLTCRASPHRVNAIRDEGAEVVLVDGTYDDAVRACAERAAAEGWEVVADVGYEGYLTTPRLITEGYSTILGEVEEQLDGSPPDVVLAQAGVGGFAAAVVEHVRRTEAGPLLAVVEPVDADPLLESARSPRGEPTPSAGAQRTIMAGLNCANLSLTAWPTLRDGVDLFLTVSDRYAMDAMRLLAHPAPGDTVVVAGESGAAGLAGLLALLGHAPFAPAAAALGLGPAATVLLFVTEADTDPDAWRRIVGGD